MGRGDNRRTAKMKRRNSWRKRKAKALAAASSGTK